MPVLVLSGNMDWAYLRVVSIQCSLLTKFFIDKVPVKDLNSNVGESHPDPHRKYFDLVTLNQ